MKKFSSVSGEKVNLPPVIKITKEENDLSNMKFAIMKLLDDNLRVQSYGSARKNILADTKITGYELFIEALIDMLDNNSLKDQVKVLESLKSDNMDWESIDGKINSIFEKINFNKDLKKNKIHISKINSLIEKYGNDIDDFSFIVDRYCSNVKNTKVSYQRAITAKMMIESGKYSNYTKHLNIISEKFLNRSKLIK